MSELPPNMILMNDYTVAEQRTIDGNIQIFLLGVDENVGNINKSIIPKDQIDEIKKYKFQHDIDKRLLTRSFLYDFLAKHHNIKDFDLVFNEYLKPSLKTEPNIHFSFSYSKDFALVGISKDRRIGIDIEYVDPNMNVCEIAPVIMCSDELMQLKLYDYDPFLQRTFFFQLFSTKEAIIKAFGMGLYYDVKSLNTLNTNICSFNSNMFIYQRLCLWMNKYTIAVCYEQ